MASSGDSHLQPHLALFPSAGVGHLTPFLRLAKLLMNHHCRITLITSLPSVSAPESLLVSRFLSSFPRVTQLQINLLPFDTSAADSDPFFRQMEAIRHSTHLLPPLLDQVSPPITAFISDTFTIAPSLPVSSCLQVPNFVLFTSSARMFSLFSYFPTVDFSKTRDGSNGVSSRFLEIPGIPSIPMASIPPWLLNSESFFAISFKKDGEKLRELDGILINTFEGLEEESLTALNTGQVLNGLPHVFPLGPFVPCEFEIGERREPMMNWLDDQPKQSVVFISFGSRTALLKDQIREVGNGVVASGYRFLWVVKTKKVTRKDEEEEDEKGLSNLVGEDFKERVKGEGVMVNRWVDQDQILAHRSIGGFVSHCGWNSIVEAAWNGVPVLAWPQHGDQKINAEVVEKKGFGMWERSWGWSSERVVGGEEIGERIKEMMASEELKMKAAEVREEARKAMEVGGSCEKVMQGLTQIWKNCKSSSDL